MVDSKRIGYLNQGARSHADARARTVRADAAVALSFIRTVTVGPGFTPGLLTPWLRRMWLCHFA